MVYNGLFHSWEWAPGYSKLLIDSVLEPTTHKTFTRNSKALQNFFFHIVYLTKPSQGFCFAMWGNRILWCNLDPGDLCALLWPQRWESLWILSGVIFVIPFSFRVSLFSARFSSKFFHFNFIRVDLRYFVLLLEFTPLSNLIESNTKYKENDILYLLVYFP